MTDTSVAISSRIRLARNISGFNFPCVIHGTEKEMDVSFRCVSVLQKFNSFTFYYMSRLSDLERKSLVERYLISKNLAANEGGVLATCNDGYLSVMINEEDHLRQQCIMRGQNIFGAYKKVSQMDKILSANIPFAVKNGVYFTACPSNLGTGLRASVMLFLPAITESGRFDELCNNASQYGLTIRGRYGEGSTNESYLCQVSNEITYKITEAEILEIVNGFVNDTIDLELELRQEMLSADRDGIEDKVYRSLGILENCLKLSYSEFVELICMIKLGLSLDILKANFNSGVDDLLVTASSATLIVNNNFCINDNEEKMRAKFVQDALSRMNISKNF